MTCTKYVVAAHSDQSGLDGYIGEEHRLYYHLIEATIYHSWYAANKEAEHIKEKRHWQNPHVVEVEVEINLK